MPFPVWVLNIMVLSVASPVLAAYVLRDVRIVEL